MLPLAAAGALDAEESRLVEQHAASCESCRRELDAWTSYARELRRLPQPSVPRDLAERTQARIFEARAAAAERRRSATMLAGLAVFAWIFGLAVWMLVRLLTGGVIEVLGANLVSAKVWFLISTASVWITAGAAAVTLGSCRAMRRIYEPVS
jgi:anti-sigma factor RsiW